MLVPKSKKKILIIFRNFIKKKFDESHGRRKEPDWKWIEKNAQIYQVKWHKNLKINLKLHKKEVVVTVHLHANKDYFDLPYPKILIEFVVISEKFW